MKSKQSIEFGKKSQGGCLGIRLWHSARDWRFGVLFTEIKNKGRHTQTKNSASNKAISDKNILNKNQSAV